MTSNFNPSYTNQTQTSGHKVTFKSGHTVANSESPPVPEYAAYSTKARVFVLNGTAWECIIGHQGPLPVSLMRKSPAGGSVCVYPEHYSGEGYLVPLMESSLTINSAFLMTASKFGAWRDPSGLTYGLGFSSIPERDNFVAAFTAVVEGMKVAEAAPQPQPEKEEETFPIMTTNLMKDLLDTTRHDAEPKEKETVEKKKPGDLATEELLFGLIGRLKAECDEAKRGSEERKQAEEALQAELAAKEKELTELRPQVEQERLSRLKTESELKDSLSEAAVLRERLRQMQADVERAEEERAGVDKILDGDLNVAVHVLVNTIASLRTANNLGGSHK